MYYIAMAIPHFDPVILTALPEIGDCFIRVFHKDFKLYHKTAQYIHTKNKCAVFCPHI